MLLAFKAWLVKMEHETIGATADAEVLKEKFDA